MKRITVVAMCLAAMFAFSAVAAGYAFAVEYLATSATGTFEATGTTAELVSSAGTVVCSTSSAKGTLADKHLGKLLRILLGCKISFLGEHTCTGNSESDKAKPGQISFEGEYHIGAARKGTTDTFKPAILALVPGVFSFTCSGLGTIEVRGSVAGLLQTPAGAPLPVGAALKGNRAVVENSGAKAVHTEFLLSLKSGEIDKPKLESNLFGGSFSEASLKGSETFGTTSPAALALEEG